MGIASTTAYLSAGAAYIAFFIPPLWLFLNGIESGMNYVDRLYPYPQPRKPFHDNPLLIYTHMYANISALGLHLLLLRFHPPTVTKTTHSRLAWIYTSLVTTGTIASIFYAREQDYGNDGGVSGTFAFGVMAAATFSTLLTSLYYILVRGDATLHREWSIRHFAVLFGNGVVFRLLANTYLVFMLSVGADFYASWCQMIYLSWIVPFFVADQYLSWERSRSRSLEPKQAAQACLKV